MRKSVTGLVAMALCGCVDKGRIDTSNVVGVAPTIAITNPTDGSTHPLGTVIDLEAVASDGDHDGSQLLVSWFVDGDEKCSGPADADGKTSCPVALAVGTSTVLVDVTDPDNLGDTDSITVTAADSEAPIVTITGPDPSGVYYSDQPISLTATVSDDQDAPPDLALSCASDVDGTLGAVTAETDGTIEATLTLSEGTHQLTLTAEDSGGQTGSDTLSVSVDGPNEPPSCAIIDPSDGSTHASGVAQTLVVQANDPNVSPDMLTAAWSSSQDGDLGTVALDTDGYGTIEPVLSLGTHTITAIVSDELGLPCEAAVTIQVGTTPQVTIVEPASGTVVDDGDTVTFVATVDDLDDPAELLTLVWESDLDGVLSTDPASADGTTTLELETLSVGSHIVTLTATDLDTLTGSADVLVDVNGRPSAPVVTLDPPVPNTTDDLTASYTPSIDPEGAPVTYAIEWSDDGFATVTATGSTLSSVETARGETWTVRVVANDGRIDSDPGEASVVIDNAPPTMSTVLLTNPAPQTEDVLGVTGTASDPDGDPVTITWEWRVDGKTVLTGADSLDGAVYFDKGQTVEVAGTPHDATHSGVEMIASVVILNTPPVTETAQLHPESPTTSDPIAATSTTSDADGDGVTVSHNWAVNGVPVKGVSGDTLDPSAFVRGDVITVEIIPHDGTENGTSLVSSGVIATNTPPDVSVVIDPAAPTTSSVLTATVADDDPDGDSPTLTYTWTVNGIEVIGETGPILSPDHTSRDDVIGLEVFADDGYGGTDTATAPTVVVVNEGPVADTVTIGPDPVYTDGVLQATATGTDADGDPLSWTYHWMVGGAVVHSGPEDLLDGAFFDRGDEVQVEAEPFDGLVTGAAVTSNQVVVSNTPPVMTGATLDPDPPLTSQDLTAAGSGTDLNGDAVTFRYAWTVAGTAQPETSDVLSSAAFARGDLVEAEVTPFDGTNEGTPTTVSTVVGNTPPEILDLTVTAGPIQTDDVLLAVVTANDDDGDAYVLTYTWYVDGVPAGGNSSSLDGATAFDSGQEVSLVVAIADDAADGTTASWGPMTVVNTPPVVHDVLLPEPIYTDDSVTPIVDDHDADGDGITLTYAWYVNGTGPVASGDTLSGSTFFDRDDSIYVVVQPNDGELGAPITSNTVIVANTAPTATVDLSPLTPRTSDDLTAIATGYDADTDGVTFTYTWQVAGLEVQTGSDPTLASAHFAAGETVTVLATPNDGYEDGMAATASITIANTPPSLSLVQIDEPLYTSDDATVTVLAQDDDGDVPTYSYAWTINGNAAGDADTLDHVGFDKGDIVAVEVTAHDDEEPSEPRSDAVVVANTPPKIDEVTLDYDGLLQTDDIVTAIVAGELDADGDSISYTYAWFIDGTLVVSGTNQTFDCTTPGADSGASIHVEVTPYDGDDYGDPVASAPLTIDNSPPTVVGLVIPPLDTATDATVIITATDADGDSLSYEYLWEVVDTGVTGTDESFDSANYARDQTVSVQVTVRDGTDTTSQTTSAVVGNASPTSLTLTVQSTNDDPTVAYTHDDLLAILDGDDPDGDGIVATFAWTVDGTLVAGETGPRLSGDFFVKEQPITVSVITCTDDYLPNPAACQGGLPTADTEILNSPPVLVGSVDISPDPLYTDDEATITVDAADADEFDTPWVVIEWRVDGGAAGTGTTLSGSEFDRGQIVEVLAYASDGTEESDSETDAVTVSDTPPEVSVALLYTVPLRTQSILGTDVDVTDADGDIHTPSYQWYVDDIPSTTGPTLDGAVAFDKGDEVYVVVTVGTVTATSDTVTIDNTPPVAGTPTLSPAAPTTTQDVAVVPTPGSDDDGDAVDYSYTWTIQGGTGTPTDTGYTGQTLSAAGYGYVRDDVIEVCATPNDGEEDGAPACASATVIDTPPEVFAAAIVIFEDGSEVDTARTDAVLSYASATNDDDGDPITVVATWHVLPADGGPQVDILGSTLDGATDFDAGDEVWLTLVPETTVDGVTVAGAPFETGHLFIENTAPSIGSVVINQVDPTTTTNLSVTVIEDPEADGDPIALQYQWRNSLGDIGLDSPNLGSAEFVKGDVITVTVTPFDGSEYGDPVTSDPVTIVNTLPTAMVAINEVNPKTDDTLTTAWGTLDADGDPVTATFDWYVNRVWVQSGVELDTLDGAHFAKGDAVEVRLLPHDGEEQGTTATALVTIDNSAPTVAITGFSGDGHVGGSITVLFDEDDADGDGLDIQYQWQVDTGSGFTTIKPATTETLALGSYTRGDLLRATVTVDDGDGGASDSAETVIDNAPPTVTSAFISPASPQSDASLTANVTAGDPDGDSVSTVITWYANGIAMGTGPTYTGLVKGEEVHFEVVATDDYDGASSDPYPSAPVTIGNTPPTLTLVTLSPSGTATTDQDITVASTVEDHDSDLTSVSYQWYANSLKSPLVGETDQTLTSDNHAKGDTIIVEVVATDGTSTSDVVRATVNIVDTPPVAAVADITPGAGSAREYLDDLTCAPTSPGSDVDGDPITYAVSWSVDGSPYAGPTSTTTISGDTVLGVDTCATSEWSCTLTTTAGGTSVDSTSVRTLSPAACGAYDLATTADFTTYGDGPNHRLGSKLALHDGDIVATVRSTDTVYLFSPDPKVTGGAIGSVSYASTTAATGTEFGTAVVVADTMADGVPDVIVTAPDDLTYGVGLVTIFDDGDFASPRRGAGPFTPIPYDLGRAIAAGQIGDPSDQPEELAVGNPDQASVYVGSVNTWPSMGASEIPAVMRNTIVGDPAGDTGSAIDIGFYGAPGNGDLAVGAPNNPKGMRVASVVTDFAAAGTVDLTTGADFVFFNAGGASVELGAEVSIQGDLDGSGANDFVASDPGAASVHVLWDTSELGYTAFLDEHVVVQGAAASDFGRDLLLDDVNGDGFDDMVVGTNDAVYGLYGPLTAGTYDITLGDDDFSIPRSGTGDILLRQTMELVIGERFHTDTLANQGAIHLLGLSTL